MAKLINWANNEVRDIELSVIDLGEDGEYTGTDFVEISTILVMQGVFFLKTISFDCVWASQWNWQIGIGEISERCEREMSKFD